MKAVLYKLSSPSGKQYIGVTTCSLPARVNVHQRSRTAIGSAIRKYGGQMKQEILIVGDEDYIYDLEYKAIEAFGTMAPHGYNLREGGQGGRLTEASRKKISNTMKGRKRSVSHRRRLSEVRMGHVHTAETRKRMVTAQRARRAREGLLEKQAMSQKMKQIRAERKM